MKIAVDTETALMRPGLAAPPMACTSWADEDGGEGLYHVRESREPLRRWLAAPDVHLYGLNFAYDTCVAAANFGDLLELLIEAYLDCRIHDVGLDQRLIDITNGELDGRWEDNPDFDPTQPMKGRNKPRRWRKNKYALAELTKRLWGEFLDKADTWRLSYGHLIDVPLVCARQGCKHEASRLCVHPKDLQRYGRDLCQWPTLASDYAVKDAVKTMQVHLWQCDHAEIAGGYTLDDVLVDSGAQAAAAFALQLMTCRGIRTDAAACKALVHAAEAEIERCRDLCARTMFDGDERKFRMLTEAERLASDDAPTLIVPVLKGRKGHKTRSGKWSKNLEHARACMLGAMLRGAGLPDDDTWQGWLVSKVREVVETIDEIPKDRHITIEHEDEDGYTEINVKLTKSGDISLDAEACKDVNDPVLRAYATFTSATTLRSKAKRMAHGALVPLQTRFQPLVASGRTSSSKSDKPLIGDNFQNFRRNAMENELGEELPGQRECIIARDGYDLCSIDGDNAEMRGEGQIAIWSEGYSNLADVLNRGEDAHLSLAAAQLLKQAVAYGEAMRLYKAKDPEVDNARQFAKVPNFALLGGARAKTMIPYAKGMNITLTDERALQLYEAFHAQWPEIAPMHKKVKKALRDGGGVYVFEQWVSKRLRLIDRYTVGCNTPFQGLIADAFKSTLLWLAAECYTGKEYAIGADGWRIAQTGRLSPLQGSYPVLFCHDEVIFELKQTSYQHEAAFRARDVMVQAINRFLPDVKMTAEPALMRKWWKSAKSVYDANGRLTVWEPKPKDIAALARKVA